MKLKYFKLQCNICGNYTCEIIQERGNKLENWDSDYPDYIYLHLTCTTCGRKENIRIFGEK